MPLYIVALKGPAQQFTTRSVLVRASDHKAARMLAATKHRREGSAVWFDSKESTCLRIDVAGEPDVLMVCEADE